VSSGAVRRNRLLNQFTADATGRRVVAGPVEATALGNIAVQMLATGAVGSLAEARAIIEQSFPVERYDPSAHDRWDASTLGSRTTWRVAVAEVLAPGTGRLDNLWDEREAAPHCENPLRLLRYRSNLLGADLRITNFAGGNTSAKFELPDPLTNEMTRVLAVKGSGGDLGSMDESGFAVLRLDALERLMARYRGEPYEDEMVDLYPLCAFGGNRVPASIDTPLHALLPFAHVDHLHPDWAIALAASANGQHKLEEFNARYGRHLVWIPWQRPGFELATMIRRAVEQEPACDGLVLASHGLFTWGETAQTCYANSIATIDQLGAFVEAHRRRSARPLFGGPRRRSRRRITWRPRLGFSLDFAAGCRRHACGRALERLGRRANVRRFRLGRRLVSSRHELPGSLSPHAHLSAVRAAR
jgi:hypothetical protein